jgi:hypothetical protein
MGSLSNLYISQSYQSLIHLGTNNTASANLIGLEDGLGNSIGISVNTSGSLYLSGSLTASLQNGYVLVGDSLGRTQAVPTSSFIDTFDSSSLVTTASFNAYTQSNDQKVNTLIAATASYANSASVAAVDAAQQSQINNLIAATASYVTDSETGSFARYDVSNPWSADQTFTNISAVSASFTYVQTLFETASVIYSSGSNQFGDELTDVQTLSGSVKVQGSLTVNGVPVVTSSVDISALNQATASLQAFTESADIRLDNLEAATASYAISSSVAAVDAAQQLQINSLINATSSYADSASFAASQLVQDNRLGSLEAATSSYAISSSVAVVDAAQQAQINSLIAYTSSVQTLFVDPSLNTFSGSLAIIGSGATSSSAALAHLSASAVGQTNLVFKNNSNITSTVISGSGNIFMNQVAPAAGFVRYMSTGNIGVAANGIGIPQITSSMAFSPTISNNYFGVPAVPVSLRGPVSSSAYVINNNVLAGGQLALGPALATSLNRAVSGLNVSNNVVAGQIATTAAKTFLSSSVVVINSNVGGTLTLNMDSSSIQVNGLTVQGALTINNSYLPPVLNSVGTLSVTPGLIIGSSNVMFASGSMVATGSRAIAASTILGSSNVMSASLNGDNSNIQSTTLIGQGLVVVGTNSRQVGLTGADYGSVFVGRWNSDLGTRDTTAETVFAVGTGTSNTTRKTAFLIDSGSNAFVEGTLTVSGSTTITGSLILSSSAVNELIVIGGTVLSGSAFINNLQNGVTADVVTYDSTTGQLRKASLAAITSASFDSAEFWSTITESGSAGVSGSITFNNSGSVAGISLVNDTQITLSQAGTYNVQFSAQIETSAGADTVWMWFKKNGNNISDSASKAVLANNNAQIMTVNILDEAQANDYYELAYQTLNGDATVLYEPASGNIPAIPSVILTITQIR